jgi:hypothetical protein
MYHFNNDIKVLAEKYILSFIGDLKPVELAFYHGKIFYLKDENIILEFDKNKKEVYLNNDLFMFLEKSFGYSKIAPLLEILLKKELKLKKINIRHDFYKQMHFALVKVHIDLEKNLKQIHNLKKEVNGRD